MLRLSSFVAVLLWHFGLVAGWFSFVRHPSLQNFGQNSSEIHAAEESLSEFVYFVVVTSQACRDHTDPCVNVFSLVTTLRWPDWSNGSNYLIGCNSSNLIEQKGLIKPVPSVGFLQMKKMPTQDQPIQ